jgi:hypothetical protein
MQASFRNGKKAVEYAIKACELSEWKDPNMMDTLGAAYAEAGDFNQAIKWETKYLETPDLSEKETTDGKSRLALYQAHKPYHRENLLRSSPFLSFFRSEERWDVGDRCASLFCRTVA